MRRLLIGTALAGGVAFALRRLAWKGRKLPEHCREMVASGRPTRVASMAASDEPPFAAAPTPSSVDRPSEVVGGDRIGFLATLARLLAISRAISSAGGATSTSRSAT